MAININKYLKYLEAERIRKGFADDWEQFAVTMNWKTIFGEDLPKNYYHPRDFPKLQSAMNGIEIHAQEEDKRRN